MRLVAETEWKECDNCDNQVPYPRALCPVCEVNPDRDKGR